MRHFLEVSGTFVISGGRVKQREERRYRGWMHCDSIEAAG